MGVPVQVGVIRQQMSVIRRNIKLIETKHGQALTAISADQGRQSSEALDKLITETNGTASDIRTKLKVRPVPWLPATEPRCGIADLTRRPSTVTRCSHRVRRPGRCGRPWTLRTSSS